MMTMARHCHDSVLADVACRWCVTQTWLLPGEQQRHHLCSEHSWPCYVPVGCWCPCVHRMSPWLAPQPLQLTPQRGLSPQQPLWLPPQQHVGGTDGGGGNSSSNSSGQ